MFYVRSHCLLFPQELSYIHGGVEDEVTKDLLRKWSVSPPLLVCPFSFSLLLKAKCRSFWKLPFALLVEATWVIALK